MAIGPIVTCWICGKPIGSDECKTDDRGRHSHTNCHAAAIGNAPKERGYWLPKTGAAPRPPILATGIEKVYSKFTRNKALLAAVLVLLALILIAMMLRGHR